MATETHKTPAERKKSVLSFLISLALAIGLTFLIREPQFTTSQVYVVFILLFAIGLWFTEAIPPFAVALFIMTFLAFFLGNKNLNDHPEDVSRYVNTFSSSIIWLMLGGFFLAAAMTKTAMDEKLFRFTVKLSGTNPRNLLIGLMSTTMVASMLMSNTATTAMIIAAITPLLNSMGKQSGISKALLLGVPIAATTGGMATIIGSPPNAIAAGALEHAGIPIDFLTWMKYGMPVTLILTSICCIVLIFKYVKDTTPISLDFLEQTQKETTREERIQRNMVLVIILSTIALWLTGSLHGIPVAGVSGIAIVALTVTGIINGKDVQRLPWDTLLLVAGGLSLGTALQHSGLLNHYAEMISQLSLSSMAFLFIFAYLTMVFSNIMSNTATSTVLIPLGLVILATMKTEIALIIGLSASTALFLPVSTPPNAIAFSTGMLDQKDFRTGGILVGLLGPALIIGLVLLLS